MLVILDIFLLFTWQQKCVIFFYIRKIKYYFVRSIQNKFVVFLQSPRILSNFICARFALFFGDDTSKWSCCSCCFGFQWFCIHRGAFLSRDKATTCMHKFDERCCRAKPFAIVSIIIIACIARRYETTEPPRPNHCNNFPQPPPTIISDWWLAVICVRSI